jgi:hypothetical protein
MTSMFDYDDSLNLAYNAKVAGKAMIAAKYEVLSKTGDFLFLAHSEKELALRCQMVERDIEQAAYGRLAAVSDSKAKLVRAIFDEWTLRHASCTMCKTASDFPTRNDNLCPGNGGGCGSDSDHRSTGLFASDPTDKIINGFSRGSNNLIGKTYCAEGTGCNLNGLIQTRPKSFK